MPKSSIRARRIADLIQQQVGVLIKREINDPRLKGVSITAVDVSPDLGTARIYYSILPNVTVEDAEKALLKATGYIRHQLGVQTKLRYLPNLHFIYDEKLISAERVTSLIDRTLHDQHGEEE